MPVIEGSGQSDVDIVVIGAGTAGLAAARRLMTNPRLSVLVLEAGSRIGGRAHTVFPEGSALPLDMGCQWLHGALSNAWTGLAGEYGFTVDRRPAPWDQGEGHLSLSPDEEADYHASASAFEHRVLEVVVSGADMPLGACIEPDHRWRGMLDAVSTYVNGVELDEVSCLDHARYNPGEGADWRVVEGYGGLIGAFGAAVPVSLATIVTGIDHSAAHALRIETDRGPLTARAVMITVSTNVLASGAIRFTPALPHKMEAAANLLLGVADKLFLRLDGADGFEAETYRMGSPHRAATGTYHVRPFGRPVIECFYGGQLARDLERGGEPAFEAFAAEELVALFGGGIRARLAPILASAWAKEPHVLGSYSYARPGAADARAVLAAPVDNRLFFAGEACSPHRFTTAHGAYESGVAAAEALLRGLDRSRATVAPLAPPAAHSEDP